MSLYDIESLGYIDYPAQLQPGPVQADATLSPGELYVVIPETAASSESGFALTQTTPAATWIFPNTSGKMCDVDVFVGGSKVMVDVDVTETNISVSFGSPQSGYITVQPTSTSF